MTVPNNANYFLPPIITIPSALEISSITRANPMVVTASGNSDQVNTYVAGQLVRFNIPYSFGMWQLANMTLPILSVGLGLCGMMTRGINNPRVLYHTNVIYITPTQINA